jgi:hypothetical protein
MTDATRNDAGTGSDATAELGRLAARHVEMQKAAILRTKQAILDWTAIDENMQEMVEHVRDASGMDPADPRFALVVPPYGWTVRENIAGEERVRFETSPFSIDTFEGVIDPVFSMATVDRLMRDELVPVDGDPDEIRQCEFEHSRVITGLLRGWNARWETIHGKMGASTLSASFEAAIKAVVAEDGVPANGPSV